MTQGKLGRIYERQNTTHEFGSADSHKWIRVEDANGSNERWLRMSDADIARMEESAQKNIEDAPKVGFITDLLD